MDAASDHTTSITTGLAYSYRRAQTPHTMKTGRDWPVMSVNRKVILPPESPRFTHPTTTIARHCGVPRVIGADYRSLVGISPEERSGSTILSRLVIANQSSSLLQIVLFQELGPECLWRRRNVRSALRGE